MISSPRARMLALLVTLGSVLACSAATTASPTNAATGSPAPSATAAAARPTEPPIGQDPTPAPPVAGSTAGPGATPTSQTTSPNGAESDTETFPSGLVVDQKLLGGPGPGPELPRGSKVLHVGDSFAGALGIELNKVLSAAGVVSRLDFEKSTYIPTWAHSAKLAGLLSSFKPDLVLISLGANELENPEPEKRAPLIQRLVKSVGTTPCVWIAPVLWDGAKGALLDVIRTNVGNCIYLDSNALIRKMPRAGDKIHPSMAARPDWAAATARWLAYHRKPAEQQPWTIVGTP